MYVVTTSDEKGNIAAYHLFDKKKVLPLLEKLLAFGVDTYGHKISRIAIDRKANKKK